jgi:hypothetical protein
MLKVICITKGPFRNVLENKPAKSKNRRTNSQPKKIKDVDETATGREEIAINANRENDAPLVESFADDWIQCLHVEWAYEKCAILGGLPDNHNDVCDCAVG